ncbi:MAG: hypothetical protein R2880_02605 [Deinococcales bacterium]
MGKGRLERIYLKRFKGGPMDEVSQAKLIRGQGLAGNADQKGKRQVTLLEKERWEDLMKALGADLDPSIRRANLLVSGISLTNSRQKILKLGDARLCIYGETKPCEQMDKALLGLKDLMFDDWGGGAFAEVLDDGEIYVGNDIIWENPE